MIQKLLATLAFVVVAAGMAHAETWRGRLIDATCMDQQQSQQTPAQACNPTATTTAFAINVSGKVYRLDDAGNAKAAEALRNRANREKTPEAPAVTETTARVTGSIEGETIKVDKLEIQ